MQLSSPQHFTALRQLEAKNMTALDYRGQFTGGAEAASRTAWEKAQKRKASAIAKARDEDSARTGGQNAVARWARPASAHSSWPQARPQARARGRGGAAVRGLLSCPRQRWRGSRQRGAAEVEVEVDAGLAGGSGMHTGNSISLDAGRLVDDGAGSWLIGSWGS